MSIPTYKLFEAGHRFFTSSANPATDEEDAASLDPVVIGNVNLPTGRIIVGDPLFMVGDYYKSFTRTVAPGSYPAIVAVLSTKSVYNGETKWYPANAAAMLRFSDGEPVTWEMALTEGQDIETLEPGQFFGYGVDAGVAGFFSPEAMDVILTRNDDSGGPLKDCGYKRYERFVLPDTPDLDVAMCIAGEGDGSYASYWGLDEAGTVICLATDFALLYNPDQQGDKDEYE